MRLRTALTAAVLAAMSAGPPPCGADSPAYTPPRGLQDMPIPVPSDNPMTPGRIALGEQLFFDARLSATKKMSCETCHVPEKGWTDALKLSPKFDGSLNSRHTPTLFGVAYYSDLYWDGRAKGLEAQIAAAWKGQMGADPDAVARELAAVPGYAAAFQKELDGEPTPDRIVKALASFVRTIQAGDTAYDRMPPSTRDGSQAGQGFRVFSQVGRCTLCHLPPTYSDGLFHNVGIGSDAEKPDLGRGKILADAASRSGQPAPPEAETLQGAFKTPTLRGIALTGPYFHDGRAATLEEAVDLMAGGGIENPHRDVKLKAVKLTAAQRRLLLTFLRSLTPPAAPYKRPALP